MKYTILSGRSWVFSLLVRFVRTFFSTKLFRQTLFFFFFILSITHQANGQSTINVCGGTAQINNAFSLDWSVGESSIIDTYFGSTTHTTLLLTSSWNLTSGVLQPFDNKHLASDSTITFLTSYEARAFPIPATNGVITLDIRSVLTGTLSVFLMDAQGKTLGRKNDILNATSFLQQWSIAGLSSGVYVFHIVLTGENGKVLKQGNVRFIKS